MNCRAAVPAAWTLAIAAGLVSGCASDNREHPAYWWNATVISVERVADLPSGVDLDCIPAPAAGVAPDDRPVMVVKYKVGKSPVIKAYADAKGAAWFAGERVLVHPDSCRIKPALARAS